MLFASLNTPEIIPIKDGELVFWPDFLSEEGAQQLYLSLDKKVAWEQSDIIIAGQRRKIPRLNAWYGERQAAYSYSGTRFTPNPWIPELQATKSQVEKRLVESLGESFSLSFNSALVNLYRDGQDSVGWHSDNEPELGPEPVIASLSLGATRTFQLKHKVDKQVLKLPLASGSLLLMAGAMQQHWLHQVPKQPEVDAPRINCTFRHVITDTRHY